jgi:hypothetical protein
VSAPQGRARRGVCVDVPEPDGEGPKPDDLVRCLACHATYSHSETCEDGCPACGHAAWIAAAIPLPADTAPTAAAASVSA